MSGRAGGSGTGPNGGRRGIGGRGRLWTARAVLRVLFACAMAAVVIWGGGGVINNLDKDKPAGDERGGGRGSGEPSRGGDDTASGKGEQGSGGRGSGIEKCADDALTPEADAVIDAVRAGGPFEYPDKDGSRFGNREGILPDEPRDWYAEYTVPTPGESDRGARRIVTGGDTTPRGDSTQPKHWYWTDDHYESFCEFAA